MSGNDNDPDGSPKPYKVGNKRPPKHTQWKPNESGNPNGWPRGRKSFKTELREVFEERIPIRVNGANLKVSMVKAMLLALRQKTLAGDQAAMDRLLRLMHQHLPDEDVRDATKSAREDEDLLNLLLADDTAGSDGDDQN